MSNVNPKESQILQLFERKECWAITNLSLHLNYSDRSTQRLLKEVGYYSSFSHNGKWYTIQTIPKFDVNGLWFHNDIGFSKYRSLTATIFYLIENSSSGLTAKDLSSILLTSCPPVLNRLNKDNKICRVKAHRGFVYISINPATKNKQLNSLDKDRVLPRLSEAATITVLVEFIRNPYQTSDELALQLQKKEGISCSANTIESLFVSLGLEKKIHKKQRRC